MAYTSVQQRIFLIYKLFYFFAITSRQARCIDRGTHTIRNSRSPSVSSAARNVSRGT